MHLDHDHREGENVRFFAMYPLLIQDLRRGPPRSVALITRTASYRIQVLSDPSKPKIRDSCVAGTIHKNIWLMGRQYGGKTGLGQSHTPLRSP